MLAYRIALCMLICLSATGCASIDWSRFEDDKSAEIEAGTVQGDIASLTSSAAYRDTIAQYAWIEGTRTMRVRGYGLVYGLGDQGSAECPRRLRERLIQELYKQPEFEHRVGDHITPEEFIDSTDTAVVLVQGEIPAAVKEGSRFDLYVEALAGTQTVAIEGGTLWRCPLRIFRDISVEASIPGKELAYGEGPIFRNPFAIAEDAATRQNPRRGVVISGGTTLEDRRIRLVLGQPSYRQSMTIARRINERFAGTKVAESESPSYIRLHIPDKYRDDPAHFLGLVRHLYLPRRAGFSELRCEALVKEIQQENPPYEDIALAWEGIGRPVLSMIAELYDHPRETVRFYAARTGVRLGNEVALTALADLALKPSSAYRLQAIETLGKARDMYTAREPLRKLLNDPDPRIAVAAYEALRRRGDPTIASWRIGDGNFVLERVLCARENLIYARRTDERRIAVFGRNVTCEPPVFYDDPGQQFMLNASDGEPKLTVFRKIPDRGIVSPPIPAGRDVAELLALLGHTVTRDADGEVLGLGVDYSAVVQAMRSLCHGAAINARFMLEQPATLELFGPDATTGRPESEI